VARRAEPEGWSELLQPADITDAWRETLLRIPGYDSIATAGDCRFDPTAAQTALDFFPECLQHVEGAKSGQPFVLELWQQAVNANIFGWQRIDEAGRIARRYREVFIYVPRKNGKSPWVAGITIYVTFCDPEPGQQNYIAAQNRDQAGKLFRHAKGMVEREPELDRRCKIYGGTAQAGQSKSIVLRDDQMTFLQVMAADAGGQHGGNPYLVAIDELHAQPNRELIDVLTSSTASLNRKQTLVIYITTADFDRPSICNEKYAYAGNVRDGVIDDPGFLPVIYEAKPTDPWDQEETWRKANPNLGVSVSLDFMRRECQKAKDVPATENTFRRLHLNQRTEQDTRAIRLEYWDACCPKADGRAADPVAWRKAALERLQGKQSLGALDLGATSDLTALALLFGEQPPFTLLPWFWVPLATLERRDRMFGVWQAWAKQGFVIPTAGRTTDYDLVRAFVSGLQVFGDTPQRREELQRWAETNKLSLTMGGLRSWFSIRKVAVDPAFQGMQVCQQLMGDGLKVQEFRQGFLSFAAPCKFFLELIAGGGLDHGNNPVLRWMAANTTAENDAAGNIKWSKKRSADKIDGIVTATMAVGLTLQDPVKAKPSISWI